MIKGALADHPLRYALTNELHARPFVELDAPGRVLFLAIKQPKGAAERDPAADFAHLTAFINLHGGAHPSPGASHYLAEFGRFRLKWERHTEFVSYTLYEAGPAGKLFQADLTGHLPDDWLAAAPGKVIAAIQVELLRTDGLGAAEALLEQKILPELTGESLTSARVLDGNALATGDFRLHEGGFTRFAIIVHGPVGPRRIGRTAQRLIEIESYRTLAMLALPLARETGRRLNEIERELGELITHVARDPGDTTPPGDAEILHDLTALSAEIESLSAAAAFRFGAGGAYETIVAQRIGMLREERLGGAPAVLRIHGPPFRPGDAHLPRHRAAAVGAGDAGQPHRRAAAHPGQRHGRGAEPGAAGVDEPPRRVAAAPAGDGGRALGGGDQLLRSQPRGLSAGAIRQGGEDRQVDPDRGGGDPGGGGGLVDGPTHEPAARRRREIGASRWSRICD